MLPASVALIYSEDRKRLLVIKRCDLPIWAFIAGGIEEGESPETTVIREVEEESGLIVKIVRKIAEYTPINRLGAKTHFFECHVLSGSPRTSPETSAVEFVPIDQLPTPFFILHKLWLEEALQNKQKTIQRPLHELSYWNVFIYTLKNPIQVFRFFFILLQRPN